jgi:hypothetical protein
MWSSSEENQITKRSMFGDPFGTKHDYLLGTFYRGRNQFLYDDDPAHPPNRAEPPNAYKTKRQAARNSANKVNNLSSLKSLNFPKKDEESGANMPAKILQKAKKQDAGKKRDVQNKSVYNIPPKFSSNDRSDWIEETQAGCHFYINHSTGEVTSECPWATEEAEVVEEELGTGALVYDGGEMVDLMATLDAYSRRKPKKTDEKK